MPILNGRAGSSPAPDTIRESYPYCCVGHVLPFIFGDGPLRTHRRRRIGEIAESTARSWPPYVGCACWMEHRSEDADHGFTSPSQPVWGRIVVVVKGHVGRAIRLQFITLMDLDDDRVTAYTHLTELQLRNRLEPSKGLFIAESEKVIVRALAAGVRPLSFLVEEPWIEGMADTFAEVDARWGKDIPVFVAKPELLKRITGYRLHRGALSAMHRWTLPTVEDICADASRIAILENIVDHTNVGALMRSAAALNVDAVLVTPSCGDPLYRRAARVSMGTVFQVPWTRICDGEGERWPGDGMAELRKLGFTTASMALSDDSISLDELVGRLSSPSDSPRHIARLALIFGTEGDGLSHRTIAESDMTVKIPMSGGVDSLNVAASSAVAFWATRK